MMRGFANSLFAIPEILTNPPGAETTRLASHPHTHRINFLVANWKFLELNRSSNRIIGYREQTVTQHFRLTENIQRWMHTFTLQNLWCQKSVQNSNSYRAQISDANYKVFSRPNPTTPHGINAGFFCRMSGTHPITDYILMSRSKIMNLKKMEIFFAWCGGICILSVTDILHFWPWLDISDPLLCLHSHASLYYIHNTQAQTYRQKNYN